MCEEIKVINVMEFIRAGETAVYGFEEKYKFLCDISHPTYMHSFFTWLTFDPSWSNELYVHEVHRILERVTETVEMAIRGIVAVIVAIYDDCIPNLEKVIASYPEKIAGECDHTCRTSHTTSENESNG
jgi:hypothetical protein